MNQRLWQPQPWLQLPPQHPEQKNITANGLFFKREHDFIGSLITQRRFWKNREPGSAHTSGGHSGSCFPKNISPGTCPGSQLQCFHGCVHSEVISGCFLISPDTLRSPSQRLISALNRAKLSEIKAVEELHSLCSPPSPLPSLLSSSEAFRGD